VPVIGHALAGLALAELSRPVTSSRGHVRDGMIPVVLLSYAPDIAAQAALGVDPRIATAATHSLLFAALCSLVVTPLLVRTLSLSASRALATAFTAVVLHDLMDVLQSPGRMPLWPAPWSIDIGRWIPTSLRGEVLFCLPFLVVALAVSMRRAPLRIRRPPNWRSVAAVAAIVLAAATISELRDRRERDLVRARTLAESGEFAAALALCDAADRWPSLASPGRVDYVRAMAWWGVGDRANAEQAYLRSYRADPSYIWAVADLAAFYASEDAPVEERRRRAEPWIAELRVRFKNHPALPQLLERVERKLNAGR
jgi:membrane-bound metal-dependent hydrolase YbcI (DUF457 family)